MDSARFDRLSRTFGTAGTRRAALRTLTAAVLMPFVPFRRAAQAQVCPIDDCCRCETEYWGDPPGQCVMFEGRFFGCCAAENTICGTQCCSPGTTCLPPPAGIAGQGYCCPQNATPCDTLCCESGLKCCGAGYCCRADLTCCGGTCCPADTTCCGNGACCSAGKDCVENSCVPKCPNGASHCGSSCCADGQVCDGDQCVAACEVPAQKQSVRSVASSPCCPQGTQPCGDACCSAGQLCCGSVCCAKSDGFCCGDVCCAEGSVCDRGACLVDCPNGQQKCGQVCCPSGTVCDQAGVNGGAVCKPCAAGETDCGGKCTNLKSNEDNCGACGKQCRKKQKCRKGRCARKR